MVRRNCPSIHRMVVWLAVSSLGYQGMCCYVGLLMTKPIFCQTFIAAAEKVLVDQRNDQILPTSSSRETKLGLRCFDILPVKGGRQKLLNETTPLIKVPIKVWRDVGEPEEEEESTFRLLQSSKWQKSSSFLPSCGNFASNRITCYINKNSSGGGLHQVVIRLSTVLTR